MIILRNYGFAYMCIINGEMWGFYNTVIDEYLEIDSPSAIRLHGPLAMTERFKDILDVVHGRR